MKRIISALTALTVVIGLGTSCQKEMESRQEISGNGTGLKVSATIADNGTKVSYQEDGTTPNPGLKPSWQVNDIIIGFDDAEPFNTYAYKVVSVDEQTKKATLERITDGDETVKGTATSDPADGTTMYMFYAPGTKPDAISNKSLTVSLANQAKDVVPAIMMAQATVANGSLSLSFSNTTAIIGVKAPVMADKNKEYTSLSLSGSTGLNTAVTFSLDIDKNLKASYQTPGTLTKALDFTSNSETGKGPDVIYIVACPATQQNLSFKFNGTEEYFNVNGVVIAESSYYRLETPSTKKVYSFTVGSGTEVVFAPGNLYAKRSSSTASDWTWGFYDKQYKFHPASMEQISTSGSRTAASEDTEIDLFCWGYSSKSTVYNDQSTNDTFTDWGTSNLGLSPAPYSGGWRTLTSAEWTHLLNSRTGISTVNGTANARYLKCKVNDGTKNVYGLMIFPDTFTWPTTVTAPTASHINDNDLAWDSVSEYSQTQFEVLEEAGVVFLPAAGYRSGAGVLSVGSYGGYWSSTANGSSGAYRLDFDGSNVSPALYSSRDYGRSVRLVSVVQ